MGNIQGQDKKLTTFQLYMKTQKEVLFTTEISKGYRPAKKRNQQAGIKHMQININHESFDHRRISQVHFNNESTIKGGNRMSFIHNNQYKNSINGLKDDRSKVDKDKYPYTCIGMLQVNFENRRNRSTAFLISSNWLLTSAHNLYSREYKMMGSQAVFVLGLQQKIEITRQNGKQIRTKLQIGDRFQISTWRIPQQYISLQSDQEAQLYDFALVKLKNIYYLQQRYGYLGLDSTWALRPNQCKELTIAGYPKQIKSNDNCKFLVDGKGQWTQILYQNQKQKQKGFIYLNYEIYTSPGQSGSPIFYQAPDKQIYMIGIHTLGGDEYNSGILMTPRCRQIINGWIQEMKSIFDISNLNIGNGGLMSFALNFGLVSNNITQLHLENNIIGAQGIKLLMKNSWQNLKILNLQDNNIKTQGALAIADPMHGWVHLQELNLNNTMIFDLGCVSILKNRSWTKMRQLHLRNSYPSIGKCQLTRQTIDELLKTKWNLLQSLTISANAFDLNDIKRIFAFIKIDENTQEKRFTRLRHLQISRTNIGNQGLQLIINCDYDLQTLAVSGIGMTYEAMKMLTEMKWKRQTLKILQIDWNKMISVEGILYMTPKNFPSITYLNLDWTTLGSQGVRQLVKHQWPYLKTLSLNHNYLQDRGLNELRSFATLEVIIVEGNNISSEGFIEFSKKKQWQNLLQINLRSNHIEKYGFCEAIIHLKGLNRIDINNNGLNSHHKREIKQFAQGVNKQLQIMVDMGEEADFS